MPEGRLERTRLAYMTIAQGPLVECPWEMFWEKRIVVSVKEMFTAPSPKTIAIAVASRIYQEVFKEASEWLSRRPLSSSRK